MAERAVTTLITALVDPETVMGSVNGKDGGRLERSNGAGRGLGQPEGLRKLEGMDGETIPSGARQVTELGGLLVRGAKRGTSSSTTASAILLGVQAECGGRQNCYFC